MWGLLQGITCVDVLLDNIFIAGPTDKDLLSNLGAVLKRLSNVGLRLKTKKYQFMKPSLECLGYRVDKEGVHPVEAKVWQVSPQPVVHSGVTTRAPTEENTLQMG